MRGLLALVSGLVAIVALAATIPMLWVSTHVVSEDGYVAFSSVLATDSELQGAFAAYLSSDFVQRGSLPSGLERTATTALTAVAGRTTNAPGFVAAWEQTQRSLHRSAFTGDAAEPLTVDLAPVAAFVTRRVAGSLPVTLPVPDSLVVRVGDAQDRSAIDDLKKTSGLGRVGVAVTAIAALAALVFARRRSVALTWLGAGTIIVAGALWIVSAQAVPKVIDRVDASSELARTLQKLLADRASDSLAAWLLWVGVVGVAMLAVGVTGRVVAGRPRA